MIIPSLASLSAVSLSISVLLTLLSTYSKHLSMIPISENTKKEVYILHQATRAAHIPGVGAFGSGFLTDPKELANKINDHHLTLLDL